MTSLTVDNAKLSHLLKRTKSSNNGCLEWTGGKDWDGYGIAYMFGKNWRASRLFYFLVKGPIPDGHQICHKCDNPSCVNPDHLFTGTSKDNVQDALRKGRMLGPRGEMNGQHKLTKTQVLEIFSRYKRYSRDGNNMYALAREFGVNPVTVFDIVNRRKWKSVTSEKKD